MKNDIVFLIISFNNDPLTEECVANYSEHLSDNNQIVLVDNGSKKNQEWIAKKYNVQYFRIETNRGYANGCNTALIYAMKKFPGVGLSVVGNDTRVTPAFRKNLQKFVTGFCQNKKIAAASPSLFFDTNFTKVENMGVEYYQSGLAFQNRSGKVKDQILLCSTFLFLKPKVLKELIRKYGYIFNPDFFMMADDIEFSLRLLSLDYMFHIDRELKAQHFGSSTIKESSRFAIQLTWRNSLWVVGITRSLDQLVKDFPLIFMGQVIMLLLSAKQGFPFLFISVYLDSIKKYTLILRYRRLFRLNEKTKAWRKHVLQGVFPRYYLFSEKKT